MGTAALLATALPLAGVASAHDVRPETEAAVDASEWAEDAAAASAFQAASPAVQFGAPSYEGTGCPPGSIDDTFATSDAGDATRYTFSVSIKGYELKVGVGGPAEQTSSCRITVKVKAAPGTEFALDSALFRGRLLLESDTRAVIVSTYGFDGLGQPNKRTLDALAPSDLTWNISAMNPDKQWSNCGATHTLVFDTSLSLFTRGRNSKGFASFDMSHSDIDAVDAVKVRIGSRPCTK